MKSVFRSLAAIALMACAAFAGACVIVVDPIMAVARKIKQAVVRFVSGALALAARWRDLNPVSIIVHRMKSFWLRQARRERPVITASWRMCPSG